MNNSIDKTKSTWVSIRVKSGTKDSFNKIASEINEVNLSRNGDNAATISNDEVVKILINSFNKLTS